MKLFQREQRSLFGEILDWMLTPLLLLWPVSLGLTWLVAQGLADKPFDRALEYNAQALAQLIVVNQRRVLLDLPQPAREILRADVADVVYFQALGPRGELLAGEKDFPAPPDEERPPPGEVRLRDTEMRGVPVRVAWVWVRLEVPQIHPSNKAGPSLALVQVAETREKRSVLATEIIKGVMLPQFVILPLAVLLVWLALVKGIKPLGQLEERIRKRKPDDLSPLDDHAVPLEVAPLVQSVNDLLTRLKDSIATQKRFLADAAHQLKTPLAGLRMQADLAQRSGGDAAELKRSLQQIGHASERATHTVNQLLSLARAEGSGAQFSASRCDLAAITMQVVRDSLPRAMDKRLDLGYEGPDPGGEGVLVHGNPTLLQEMIRNLVDNAINYTPSPPLDATPHEPYPSFELSSTLSDSLLPLPATGSPHGQITARVLPRPERGELWLQVDDSGPGIAPSERSLVFQPFYRTLGTGVDGTGLGLAIVREIAQLHNANLELSDAHPGHTPPGARFTVVFAVQLHRLQNRPAA